MQTKVIKKLDTFRVRDAPLGSQRKLLLPLSFGVSSCCLLHILDQHIRRQLSRTGRAGFELHMLHVVGRSSGQEDASWQEPFVRLQDAYPSYRFHTTSIYDTIKPFQSAQSSYQEKGIGLFPESLLPEESPSSKSDLSQLLLTKAVVAKAKVLGCEGILWGHTTTRLAERVLAETAKGRGFSLPWVVKDGPSRFDINFSLPMRDLLKKEVGTFAQVLDLTISKQDVQSQNRRTPISSKAFSIDDLMKEYFESVEKDYPSIVANVVRTSNKLTPSTTASPRSCALCGTPVEAMQAGVAAWSGDQSSKGSNPPHAREDLCDGCRRLMHGNTKIP